MTAPKPQSWLEAVTAHLVTGSFPEWTSGAVVRVEQNKLVLQYKGTSVHIGGNNRKIVATSLKNVLPIGGYRPIKVFRDPARHAAMFMELLMDTHLSETVQQVMES